MVTKHKSLRTSVHLVGTLVLGLLAVPVQAATLSVEANTCGGYQSDTKTDSTATINISGSGCWAGAYGSASAIASEFGVGASAAATHFAGSGGVTFGLASVDTTMMITPTSSTSTGPIPVKLNLFLDGGFGGGYNADQSTGRTVRFEFFISGPSPHTYSFYGLVGERVDAGVPTPIQDGVLAYGGTACLAIGCQIQSPEMMLSPNVQYRFFMKIMASVETFTGPGYGTAEFMNTFYFPLGVNVFDLPEGFTAEIAGLGVVGNRVVEPNGGEIPEPATYLFVGGGLIAAALLRRKK